VGPLVIFALDPTPEPGIEFCQGVDRVDDQSGPRNPFAGCETSVPVFPSTSRVRLGRAEAHAQIGADDLQVVAGEDLALVGVELVGEAALGQPWRKGIQEPAQLSES